MKPPARRSIGRAKYYVFHSRSGNMGSGLSKAGDYHRHRFCYTKGHYYRIIERIQKKYRILPVRIPVSVAR